MPLVLVILVNLILVFGMLSLPSLLSGGIGSIFARAWLLFGLLVFLAHYAHYLELEKNKRHREEHASPMAHHRSERLLARISEYK